MSEKHVDKRVKKRHFPMGIFVLSFIALIILATMQNRILGDYIDYTSIPKSRIIIIFVYWIVVSLAFTLFTRWQIMRNYDHPLKEFAKATKDVANGDFSVYIRPRHTSDKSDYIDIMFEDFNKMVAELGSIETLKTEFFSNVSHEIKTPLSVIQSNAEMLQRNNLSEDERRKYANSIVNSTKRLSGLITNILKLNKLEQQTIHSIPTRYDLCSQLSECALQFENVWEKKDIEFIADIEDRATIEADESLMEIVWNNLISNAIKFTDKGGTVSLEQTSTDDSIIVSVSDNGCGMNEKTLHHIFDKFYQGDTSHGAEGNGLGLALCLRVIQLSGGTITAKSVLGKGSQFTVTMPVSFNKPEENI